MAEHVHEPHVPCPKCGHQIPLTESIAAPLLEAERRGAFKKEILDSLEAGRNVVSYVSFARLGRRARDAARGLFVPKQKLQNGVHWAGRQ